MAQMPIQLLSGRAEPYAAASPAAFSAPPKTAIPRASYLYDKSGISGGLLRPGAIDQALFKAHLAAAQKETAVGPPAPTRAPISPPIISGIPNLSPAQLAALGAVEVQAGELVIDIPAPNPIDPAQGNGQGPAQMLPGQHGGTKGAVGAPLILGTGAPAAIDDAPDSAAPAATDPAPSAAPNAAPNAAPATPPAAPAAQARAERGPIPGSRRGADGAWELTRLPDNDERELLRGQKWRVVENEDSRKLFLGPDGEFGWDDFVDLINPLQHIPLVNVAYRAITGDEIYGAARLVDAAFGPLAGVSTAIDLAFRSVTGKSMAENGIAAIFGPDEAPAGDVAAINTASGSPTQLADASLIRRGSNK
jgi:hypothetical protein